ncbi:MAG: H-type lectin domain-containing protein [Yoonia sp.]|uniref:H-type lectin domain-containing protein n=1 Tax=Yoonia sp. TaxID=2212373 RepID=UPI003EFB26A9
MQRISTGALGIAHGDVVLFSDFEDDGQMWRGDGPRKSKAKVKFDTPYNKPPHVQVSISMWDISNKTNSRADVQAENITKDGFEIVFRTWNDTQVARIRVAWTAFGELPNEDGWELY